MFCCMRNILTQTIYTLQGPLAKRGNVKPGQGPGLYDMQSCSVVVFSTATATWKVRESVSLHCRSLLLRLRWLTFWRMSEEDTAKNRTQKLAEVLELVSQVIRFIYLTIIALSMSFLQLQCCMPAYSQLEMNFLTDLSISSRGVAITEVILYRQTYTYI